MTKTDNSIFSQYEILKKILKDVKKEDFKVEVYGDNAKDNLKLQKKHYLIIVVEKIIELSKSKGWQLCVNSGKIFIYNGKYWKDLERDTFQAFLGEVAQLMGVDKFDAMHWRFREDLYKQFFANAHLPKPNRGNNSTLMNFHNGTLEITEEGVVLRKHNSEDFLTYVLPFKYDPKAERPLWNNFLNKVLPDVTKQRVLAEYIAYLFVNTLKLEKVLLLFGEGANGKSVFYEVINSLLGSENITNYSLESLTDNTGYYRAAIAGKLLNYASEISTRVNPTIFKQMASGETIEGRQPYGEPLKIEDYAKLIFNCNALPRATETTHAFFRRFLIIDFDQTISEKEQDKQLSKKIIDSELSGVLNWVLEGLQLLLRQGGFTYSKAIEITLNTYKNDADDVRRFLNDEGYIKSENRFVWLGDLYKFFRVFCHNEGYVNIISKQTFSKRIKNIGITTKKGNEGMKVLIEKV